jgi:peptidoglycan L-alanyl-D-glutamate endopeptidase CwlK
VKHLEVTVKRLDLRRPKVLAELHPVLLERVRPLLAELGGRLTPWCGYRGPKEQAEAFAAGTSAARWGQSPHNFAPALAVDLVLDPRFVEVGEVDGFPALWDETTADALAAWEALERAAEKCRLERVNVNGRRDRPHLQLPNWRSYVKQ